MKSIKLYFWKPCLPANEYLYPLVYEKLNKRMFWTGNGWIRQYQFRDLDHIALVEYEE